MPVQSSTTLWWCLCRLTTASARQPSWKTNRKGVGVCHRRLIRARDTVRTYRDTVQSHVRQGIEDYVAEERLRGLFIGHHPSVNMMDEFSHRLIPNHSSMFADGIHWSRMAFMVQTGANVTL
ncbi:hypothetical protein PBRA_008531 [Plasmodiophora brassicae]|uniref:Uncharacterized protein n=1 Tax=Plasmodiophora brassicae TaxID=37360 RepID=A0A0G4J2J7_PLABS|nr:hypothetical protein PBRA_008531 [Plasmodiophora brassicae]